MVSKPKATPAASTSTTPAPATPAPAAAAPATAPTPAAAPAPAPSPAAPAPAAAPSEATTAAPAQEGFGTGSFLSGAAYQNAVQNLVEMGFPQEQVVRAMRASFNNPDRAVDYLMNGIPAHLEAEAAGPAAPAPAAGGAPAAAAAPAAQAPAPAPAAPANQPQNLFQLAQQQQQGGGGAGAGGPTLPGGLNIETLRNNPQIAAIRQAMAQNPQAAQALIQQLAQQNPQIAQIIGSDPDLLTNLFLPGEGDIPPGATVVNITPEENAAIERLQGLGFPREVVIQAYFACDKNEELAANYLFEHGFDDDD
ncbi:hypothetical protein CC2G_009230 [Coprinopsis cinerea AmutBmut pab1-1]|nr:hypothetical protein CC2G_009230 [Coprinopsis cinerea AmutBmut pab1-1]